ncbi:MAG: ATP synthase F1 subunit gamma, partial [Parachlamydiaceae bacterium]|nr:ATP synthase F1 subunit gamma [Parachlamydiaceae bacterium]
PFMTARKVKKTGVFVITADRGLCGSYNTNILSAADKFLKNYSQDAVELILMGRKAIDHYRNKQWRIRHKAFEDGEKQDIPKVQAFVQQLSDWFIKGELDEIWIIYTHFVNIISRKVIVEKFLNISEPAKGKPAINYIYEPSAEAIFNEIMPRFLVGKLHSALDEAYASELAARIISMRTATKNADEMIYSLTLTRNKVRQASITKEMLEIISGAEGLK